MKRVLTSDPKAGVTTYFHYDPEEERMVIETEQDDRYYRANQKIRESGYSGYTESRDLCHIASLGPVDVMNLMQAGIMNRRQQIVDDKAFYRWLDDPDNRKCRVNDLGLARAKKNPQIIIK